MTVYDCTMFHWEFDMLELRMKELWDVVDYFCVTESETDHRGNKRDLALTENIDRFDWAKEKLLVNVSPALEDARDTWDREKFQRFESVAFPLKKFENKIDDNDFFLISDTDEIFKSEAVSEYSKIPGTYTFQMHMYYYYYNLYVAEWFLPKAVSAKNLVNPNRLRMANPGTTKIVNNGGWHFSYIGDAKDIQYKLKTFAHDELDIPEFTSIEHIESAIKNKKDLFNRNTRGEISPMGGSDIANFEILKIDDGWPKHLKNNKYKKFIA